MNADANKFSNLQELLIEQSPDAVIFADSAGIIRIWNTAAERIFRFTKSDALGANLNIIIPEHLREAHWRGFERALAERTTKYAGQALPTKAVRSDGSQIYVELTFAIAINAKGDVLGALAHARDITKHFEKERADRKNLQKP
jgi:PAS domain S-box-containing protein